MWIDDILDESVSRPGGQSRGAGSDRKASFFREQRAGRETSGLTTKARRGLAPALIAPDCGFRIKFGLSLERDRMRFERMRARFRCVCAHRGRYDRDHACTTTPRDTRTDENKSKTPHTRAAHASR